MLVPNEDLGYSEYAATRSNLALPRNDLLPITDPALDPGAFGIHPGMPEVRDLYHSGNLAFLANTGSLIEPTTRGQYDAGTKLPVGLFPHADEQRHWQTTVPQSRYQITGWAGRMADYLTDQVNANPDVAMNIAVGKLNIWQTDDVVVPYVINRNSGAEKLNSYNHAIDCAGSGLEAMLPNIRNFYMAGATEAPIGFMSPLTA